MKTREELRLIYPKLDQANFDKLVALHDLHGFLNDNKMQQALAFKTLTDTLKNMYIYNDKKVVLKTLCESLVNDNVISEVREDCVILKNYQGRYMLQKTAINYIKHLQFEKSIKDYYIEKQKEKTETIYVNVEKLLSE